MINIGSGVDIVLLRLSIDFYSNVPQQQKAIKSSGQGAPGTLVHCWGEWKMLQQPWETVWQFLKRLHIELPCDSAILFLGIDPRGMKTQHPHKNLYINAHGSIIHNGQKHGNNLNVYQLMNG